MIPTAMHPPGLYRPKEFAFIHDAGLFHIFYMRHNLTVSDDSTETDLGHAVSTDLVNWTQLDPVLHVQPATWDSLHIWAPTMIKSGSTWYMFYAGVNNQPFAWNWFQRIGVATSTDLMTWTRYDQPVYTGNMEPWAFADSSNFDGAQFRDPFVMPDPANPSHWIMYFVTEAASARGQLIVGAARNDGGLTPWQDAGAMWCTDAAHYWGWNESPLMFQHNGLWFLFSTTPSGHPIGFRVGPSPLADSIYWSGKYRLWDFAGKATRNSDDWFAAEFLSAEGHDYFAYIDTDDDYIGIEEMVWGTPPNFFSLQRPSITAVGPRNAAPRVSVRVVGRARHGTGAMFAVALPEAMEARLDLYDVAGRRLRVLRPGALPAGESTVPWDGRDESGRVLPCSMYFARVVTAGGAGVAKVLVTE